MSEILKDFLFRWKLYILLGKASEKNKEMKMKEKSKMAGMFSNITHNLKVKL